MRKEASETQSLYFVAQQADSGAAFILSSESYPERSIEMTLQELSTFRWFMQYAFYHATLSGSGLMAVPHDIWMSIFYFLHADIARLLQRVFPMPDRIPSEHEELERMAKSLRLTQPTITRSDLCFFDYKLGHLSNAALNADLEMVQRIVTKTSADRLHILLSTETTAIITHLGIERTGTPLQMAIYDHDEDMVGYFKKIIDPIEFDRQSKKAFAMALSSEEREKLERKKASVFDYHQTMLKTQQKEAAALFAGLEDTFKATPSARFSCDASNVVYTSSAELQKAIDTFFNQLKDYIKRNSVHNPYILQRVYGIYERLHSDFNRDSFFSRKMIGGVQSFLSTHWLQHYAQGVADLSEDRHLPASHHFSPHDAVVQRVDIRCLVTSRLGVDFSLSILSGESSQRLAFSGGYDVISELISNKNKNLSALIAQQAHTTCQCVII